MNNTKHERSTASSPPQAVLKKQYRNIAVAGIVLLLLLVGILVLLKEKSPPPLLKATAREVRFTNAIGEHQIYNASIEQLQSQMHHHEKTERQLQDQLRTLQQAALQNKTDQKEATLEQNYVSVLAQLTTLKKQLHVLQMNKVTVKSNGIASSNTPLQFPMIPTESNEIYNNSAGAGATLALNGDDQLHLTPQLSTSSEAPIKNPNTYVPAGTHVLGVLLQGADLVADRYDQENPKPILIRLMARGTLPNHGRSHLKGCIITAAMTGDISSGRGNVRLERLSCVRPDHSIIDVAVYGTVSTHAKEGISGTIYSREAKRLWNATFSGTLAGIANGISQGYVQYTPSNNGPVGTVSSSNLLKYGMAQGGATGLNKLSDFEMHRADQVHPIIQVNGGQLVTVIFLKGFFFDAKKTLDTRIENNPWKKPISKHAPSDSVTALSDLLNE